MKTLRVCAAVVLGLYGLAAAAQGTREVVGQAAIVDGDKNRALEEAKRNAFRQAVEEAAGVIIEADTLTANNTLVSDRIYSRSEGYIKKYEVLGAPTVEGGVLSVRIRAEVATADLDKDLQAVKALIRRLGNRKLVIVVNENTVTPEGQVISSGVMSTVLTDGFKKDGWTILDPAFAAGKLVVQSGVTGLNGDRAKEIGQLSKADYILYGKVSYRQQPTEKMFAGAALFLVSGEYEFTVFATDSGSQLATVAGKIGFNAREDGKKISPTISYERTAHDLTKKRGTEILGEVRKAVVEYLASAEQNGMRLATTVVGLTEYRAVQNFKKVLMAQINGVREVRPGSFGNGKAEFDIVFLGTSDEFAEKLGGQKFQGKTINVTGVNGNTVELTLAR